MMLDIGLYRLLYELGFENCKAGINGWAHFFSKHKNIFNYALKYICTLDICVAHYIQGGKPKQKTKGFNRRVHRVLTSLNVRNINCNNWMLLDLDSYHLEVYQVSKGK